MSSEGKGTNNSSNDGKNAEEKPEVAENNAVKNANKLASGNKIPLRKPTKAEKDTGRLRERRDSINEFYNGKKASTQAMRWLVESGVVEKMKANEFFEGEQFNITSYVI